ncbi:hypothetical protein [Mesorhizobium ventifaucium]|uniref:Uncharacterized protein n=1 Tax=Mesorhizobium ventifaucium TaxID=666020 RepID=A0ABN8K433_9HYPH|nr:hypothetical protein [Mesorhizobium ventifaucium]CAH2405005.1 hypothetical protein MES4922_40015 [Mesorhizobium ventifaucium]
MAIITDEFIKNFQNQIYALKSLEKKIQDAIVRGNYELEQLNKNKGEPVEKVFRVPPKK